LERYRITGGWSGCKRPGGSGFTLFELLIVLFIIGIVIGVAALTLTTSQPQLQLRATVRKTAALIHVAGSRSVSECTPYKVVFDSKAGRISLIRVKLESMNEGRQPGSNETIVSRIVMPDGITFQLFTDISVLGNNGLPNIQFYSKGGCSGGKVHFVNKRDHYMNIVVDFITGLTTIKEGRPLLSDYSEGFLLTALL